MTDEGTNHTRLDDAERSRVQAAGKFLRRGGEQVVLRGVTYGTFRPGPDGAPYPLAPIVENDFLAMRAVGVNAVRVYTVPPPWFLDLAQEHELMVMVGLAWEQHVTLLDDERRAREVVEEVGRQFAQVAGHPAIALVAVGNEVPSPIVRWHGPRRVEAFLERLCAVVAREDPSVPTTYANYPSTEYLELPFVDVVSFNVFIEEEVRFDDYVARLQCLAGDRPLVLTEIGLDRGAHGERRQASLLESQIASALSGGAAGAFVFSWTDEWHRGGHDVTEWRFGVTDAERRPQPALAGLAVAFNREAPRAVDWPRASVIVCTFNGAATLGDCLDGILDLDYPDFEVVVVDDGSTDASAVIAARSGVRVISTENRGLSAARTTGLEVATGEVVAYIDDDAVPDRRWLRYAVATLSGGLDVGVGGPNIPPPAVSTVETAVACAPGGPTHVLLSDRCAEHIPGCNMVFWRDALLAVGGFEAVFRIAGDDVDMCWRLQARGWTLGFSPAAMVWHHRRSTVRAYLRQQFQYGRAEALLERRWPEKYNRGGHLAWAGRVYAAPTFPFRVRRVVRYGRWGRNLFQSSVARSPSIPGLFPLMPEWYLLIAAFAALTAYDEAVSPPLLRVASGRVPVAALLLVAALLALAWQAGRAGWRAARHRPLRQRASPSAAALTALLFVLQPVARLAGRLRYGLTPWRRRGILRSAPPWPVTTSVWTESPRALHEHLADVEARLRPNCMHIVPGGETDRWDLHARLGPLGAARLRATVEEHDHGRQLLRFRIWPRWSPVVGAALSMLAAGALVAARIGDLPSATLLLAAVGVLALRSLQEVGAAVNLLREAAAATVPVQPVTGLTLPEPGETRSLALTEAARG